MPVYSELSRAGHTRVVRRWLGSSLHPPARSDSFRGRHDFHCHVPAAANGRAIAVEAGIVSALVWRWRFGLWQDLVYWLLVGKLSRRGGHFLLFLTQIYTFVHDWFGWAFALLEAIARPVLSCRLAWVGRAAFAALVGVLRGTRGRVRWDDGSSTTLGHPRRHGAFRRVGRVLCAVVYCLAGAMVLLQRRRHRARVWFLRRALPGRRFPHDQQHEGASGRSRPWGTGGCVFGGQFAVRALVWREVGPARAGAFPQLKEETAALASVLPNRGVRGEALVVSAGVVRPAPERGQCGLWRLWQFRQRGGWELRPRVRA